MIWTKVRRNFLLYSSFIGYVIVVVLILLFLDRSAYQEKKKSLITEHYPEIFPDSILDRTEMTKLAQEYFILRDAKNPNNEKRLVEAEAKLTDYLRGVVDSELSIYQISLTDTDGNILIDVAKPEKIKEFNTWENSLFLRNFKSITSLPIPVAYNSSGKYGRFIAVITTPKNFIPVEELTTSFRIFAGLIFASLTFLYGLLFFILIRPMMRVIQSLEREVNEPARVIYKPGTKLERYYNDLVRSALLMEVQTQLHDEQVKGAGGVQMLDLFKRIPTLCHEMFPFFHVSILEFAVSRSGHTLRNIFSTDAVLSQAAKKPEEKNSLVELISPLFGKDNAGADASVFQLNIAHDGNEDAVIKSLVLSGRDETCLAIMITLTKGITLHERWHFETATMLTEQIESVIVQTFTQQLLIFREKSETSVNLSRNLGHDLTNIIATGKLDLLTVKQFLTLPVDDLEKSQQKRDLFKQSLDALINNTKFMQEIVNIYRSFSYIKKPIYETCDMNELAQDTVTLFALATSRGIKFESELNPHVPLSVQERRLIKLALFNMLNNAAESIQRRTRSENIDGIIIVKTLYNPEDEMVGLSVADNGSGIRKRDGGLATEEEIDHIFSLGYTTKQREEGEGLGLNWVYSIVSEFHNGRISARNRTEEEGGGAEFQILLPMKPPIKTPTGEETQVHA